MKLDGPIPTTDPPERTAQRRPEEGGGGALVGGAASDKVLQLQRLCGNRSVQRMVTLARQAVAQAEGGALDPEVESSIQRARGGGQALDGATREHMESAFGTDFGGVRIHTGGEADRLNQAVSARAFTTGSDVFFRQGEYSPGSSSGRELLAHELTHVVQQGGSSSLQAKLTLGPVDDPAEREADEAARNVMQRSAVPASLQRSAGGVLRRDAKAGDKKEYTIKVPPGVTTPLQLLRYAEIQIFGRVIGVAWDTSKSAAARDPAKNVGKAIPFRVASALIEKYGVAQASAADKAETDKTYKGLDKGEKDAINQEIDKRYYESMQVDPGTKIKPGEKGKEVVWNNLMAQVLADRKKLAELPDTVKSLLGPANFTPEHYQMLVQVGEALSQLSADELKAFFTAGPQGAVITPADYPRLLSIAQKLAALPPEARKDYLARVSASTTSLADLEAAIDRYIQFRAERQKQFEGHEAAAKPLLGGEDLYAAYRAYKALEKSYGMAKALKGVARDKAAAADSVDYLKTRFMEAETRLFALLKLKGFDSIAAFEAALESYRVAFRTQAVNLALDVLARYDHMLYEEKKKLQAGGAAQIAQGIAATQAKAQYKEYHSQTKTADAIWAAKEPKETWWQKPHAEAKSAAAAAKSTAESEVLRGSGGDPLIAERNVDLEKLAGADAAGVQTYLTELIADRSAKVQTARQEFKDDPDRVFKLPDLVSATRSLLGIDPSTIYGQMVTDYIRDEANKHLLSGIALGILAVALSFLVPGGGWLAAAALVAQAGISTHQAYTAYKEYQEQQRDYELGFLSEEPSLFWVGVAIAGAALDLGVATAVVVKQSANALKALKGPMLEFAKDSKKLPGLLAQIEAASGLDAKVKLALAREAKAAASAKEAWHELLGMSSRMGGFAGAVDPGFVKQLFRTLYYSVKRGVNSIARLSADAKFLDIAGDLTRMSGAERAQIEAALDEVKQLVAAGHAKGMDEKSLVGFVDRWALNRGKPGFQTKLAEEMKMWKPLSADQEKALAALESQKRTIANLYDQKAAAEEELAELRALKDKNPDDIKEIRALEAEIRLLDPQALPAGAKPAVGKGKIAEAEAALVVKEAEAAKSQLSLYDRLRAAAPSEAAKNRTLKGAVADRVGPLKTKPTPLQADHIVSVREISDMDGFADLPWKTQKDIVDMKDNLIAMDGAANASKGDRTWRSWPQSGNFYGQSTIDDMVKEEARVRKLIEDTIKAELAKLPAGKP